MLGVPSLRLAAGWQPEEDTIFKEDANHRIIIAALARTSCIGEAEC